MKRSLAALVLFGIGMLAFSQTAVTQKLDTLGIKNASVKDNPASLIKKMYRFDENKLKGAIVVFTLKELKLDVFALIVLSGNGYAVKSIEPVDPKAYGTIMMGRIKGSLAKWDDMAESAIPDAVSQATKYSKPMFLELRDVVGSALSLLKKN